MTLEGITRSTNTAMKQTAMTTTFQISLADTSVMSVSSPSLMSGMVRFSALERARGTQLRISTAAQLRVRACQLASKARLNEGRRLK